jgi:hypothetical protein
MAWSCISKLDKVAVKDKGIRSVTRGSARAGFHDSVGLEPPVTSPVDIKGDSG